jgi:hypothetical protein
LIEHLVWFQTWFFTFQDPWFQVLPKKKLLGISASKLDGFYLPRHNTKLIFFLYNVTAYINYIPKIKILNLKIAYLRHLPKSKSYMSTAHPHSSPATQIIIRKLIIVNFYYSKS